MIDGGYWTRTRLQRLPRRRLLAGTLAGSAGLAALAAGCSSKSNSSKGSAASSQSGGTAAAQQGQAAGATPQPRRGGIITHSGGNEGSFDTQGVGFDPYTYLSLAAVGYRLFYQGLLRYDVRTYAVQPELAQKWEQPSPTEYLFTLQPGVKWHNKPPANGRTLTIDDLVFSLNRARTNDPKFFSRAVLLNVDKIEAANPTTLRITTKQPDVATLSRLSGDLLLMLNPETVEKAGKFATADVVVGTGPFIMKAVEQAANAEYVRNPDYWKPGLPYLDGMRTIDLKDEQAGYSAYLSGQVDIARLNGQGAKDYTAKSGAGFTPDWFEENSNVVGQPNTKVKPFDDPRIVRASRLLIDYSEMISAWAEVWFGRGRNVSIFPPALAAWDFTHDEYAKMLLWKQPKDDAVKEGLALLGAAGYNKDNPLKFEVTAQDVPFQLAWNQLAQAQWKRLSQGVIDVTLKPLDIASANAIRAQRQFVYQTHGFIASVNEPDAWLTEYYHTGSPTNFTNFSDPKFDDLTDKQRTIFDVGQRKAAVKEIVQYMIDHGPVMTPSGRNFLESVNPKLHGYIPEFYMNGTQYETVWLSA